VSTYGGHSLLWLSYARSAHAPRVTTMNEKPGVDEARDRAPSRANLPPQVQAAVAKLAEYSGQASNLDGLASAIGELVPLEVLTRAILSVPDDEHRLEVNAHLIGELVQRYIRPYTYQHYFKVWQEYGFHVSPVHFYYPIPDTRTLADDTWD